ncbi:MAG: hypothetical protein EPN72_09640 [Nevskiaceae bacterium]|nr:MAG: hypothetical protein EPN63_08980 [Nevskiaceae bacterium]TBR72692.1 MAG: hypothetical protein EPN72_09640 [Nevskiaceae bacterium]
MNPSAIQAGGFFHDRMVDKLHTGSDTAKSMARMGVMIRTRSATQALANPHLARGGTTVVAAASLAGRGHP